VSCSPSSIIASVATSTQTSNCKLHRHWQLFWGTNGGQHYELRDLDNSQYRHWGYDWQFDGRS
jgi:hypothetical protein